VSQVSRNKAYQTGGVEDIVDNHLDAFQDWRLGSGCMWPLDG